MIHQSYGQFTPEQIKEAMNKPFGQTHRYLEATLSGVCKHCTKPIKNISAHLVNNAKCREKNEKNQPSIMDFGEQ